MNRIAAPTKAAATAGLIAAMLLLAGTAGAVEEDYEALKATCLEQLQSASPQRTRELAEMGVTREAECHAIALIGRGRFAEAAHAFTAIADTVAHEPQFAAFYLRLAARGWTGGEDLERAEATYDAALEALPDWELLRLERAIVRMRRERFPEAGEDLEAILDEDPDNVAALMERGWLHRLTGDGVRAREDWRRVIELAPDTEAADKASRLLRSMDEKGE